MKGGYVGYRDDDSEVWAFVRFRVVDGDRFEVATVSVGSDDRAVDSNDLRAVPLGRIVVFANGPGKDRLKARLNEHFDIELALGGATEVITQEAERSQRKPRTKLDIPAGPGRHPDDFYRRVAALYMYLAQHGDRPAADIAEANGIANVSTVHRWIKEARRRGFLNPGQAGKAG